MGVWISVVNFLLSFVMIFLVSMVNIVNVVDDVIVSSIVDSEFEVICVLII